MFISGAGGTGKTYLLKMIKEYSRLKFGKQEGLYGAALAMGPTGCSSHIMEGFTYHSVLSIAQNKKKNHKKVWCYPQNKPEML